MDYKELEIWVDRFLGKLVNDKKSVNTISSYKTTLNGLLSYVKTNYKSDFNFKNTVYEYIDSFGEDLSPGSINTKRAGIRSFISFLYGRDLIKADFSGNIANLKNNSKIKEILDPSEIKEILNYLSDELKNANGYSIYHKARDLTLFVFMLYTATRRGEVVKVKFSDIDFINNEIRILGKGNKERIVPLKQELKEYLYNFRDIIEKLHEAGFNVKSDYIFRSERLNSANNQKDKPMTPRNVLKIIKRVCEDAGIEKNITAHTLRHIFASYAIQGNMNIRALSDILGHSETSTTLNIYAHVISNEIKKSEMNKLEY